MAVLFLLNQNVLSAFQDNLGAVLASLFNFFWQIVIMGLFGIF